MTEEEEIQLTLDIQPGMSDGDTIKFDQIADESVGHIAGDLIFNIQQAPDEFYVRQGNDLLLTITISLLDSLVGFTRSFNHLDGHAVEIKKDTVSYCSEIVLIKNEGMPVKGKKGIRGNLLVTLEIEFPKELTQSQKDQMRKAFA